MPESGLHHWLTVSEIILAALTLVSVSFIRAPYGRHYKGGCGPTVPSRIAWGLMELPAVLVFLLVFVRGESLRAWSGNEPACG